MFRQFKYLGWSLVFLIASILTLSFYFQEGMFFDGITYSALARNLYLGYGSFWRPYYNEVFNPFYNHPPLLYWILSQFYQLIGDSMYVPKIYNTLVLLVTVWAMRSLWVKMDEKNNGLDWWPFILWFASSIVFTTYRSTMLENTLSLFTLISIRLLWETLSKPKTAVLYISLAGGFIFLGFMTKGFVALFPFAFIFLYSVCYKTSWKKIIIYPILLFSCFGMLYYSIITLNPSAKPYFDYYYHQHVFKAVSGNEAVTTMGRSFLILQLFLELSPFIILSFISIPLCKRYGLKINYRMVILFFLIGISASFPLFISPKQRTYYLIPAYPYFILGFALLMQPLVYYFISKMKMRKSSVYGIISGILILAGITYSIIFSQQKEKDADLIADCRTLNARLPDKTILLTSTELATNWRVMAYLARMGVITPSDRIKSKYMLTWKKEFPAIQVKLKLDLPLIVFDLYEIK
jgi:hypothetical protein